MSTDCDANAVCGVRCTELDLAEANTHAFHSTVHLDTDSAGRGAGLGGPDITKAMRSTDYGPVRSAAPTHRHTHASSRSNATAAVIASPCGLRGFTGAPPT